MILIVNDHNGNAPAVFVAGEQKSRDKSVQSSKHRQQFLHETLTPRCRVFEVVVDFYERGELHTRRLATIVP